MDANEADLAWAAGLFEGEGCFQRNSTENLPRVKQKRVYLGMTILSTDHDVLVRFQRVVTVGKIRGPLGQLQPHFKPQWAWSTSGKHALALCADPRFVNHLGARRRARLTEIITEIAALPPLLSRREARPFCTKGHRYTPETTVLRKSKASKGGFSRACRICLEQKRAEKAALARPPGRDPATGRWVPNA
jgi:hypothetical protein